MSWQADRCIKHNKKKRKRRKKVIVEKLGQYKVGVGEGMELTQKVYHNNCLGGTNIMIYALNNIKISYEAIAQTFKELFGVRCK